MRARRQCLFQHLTVHIKVLKSVAKKGGCNVTSISLTMIGSSEMVSSMSPNVQPDGKFTVGSSASVDIQARWTFGRAILRGRELAVIMFVDALTSAANKRPKDGSPDEVAGVFDGTWKLP